MAASDLLLRVQELGGSWLPIGTEKSSGIWIDPADLSIDADAWGTRQLQAKVRYDPRVLQPHISAFTPWELEIGGVLVASGRVKETPSQDGDDRSITITGEGWQYHLDDDAYQRVYVLTDLTRFADTHARIDATLAPDSSGYLAAGQVSAGDGVVTITFPNGTVLVSPQRVGAFIDLGPDSLAKRVVATYQLSANDANVTLYCVGCDTGDTVTGGSEVAFSAACGGSGGTNSGTFTTARRFVHFSLVANTSHTTAAEVTARLTSVQIFADTAYESGNASILVGSDIVKDAIARATLLLSPDLTQVATTGFAIPEFAMTSDQTPRGVITSATAFDDVIPRVTVEKQISVRPRPQLPIYEVGDWSGAQFQDASTNSGDQIYNAVKVSGTDATGAPVKVLRVQQPSFFTPSSVQPTNPSAAVNTTGWVALFGTLSRDTGVFDTSPASFKVVGSSFSAAMATSSWTGTFVPGEMYVITFRYQTPASQPWTVAIQDANGALLARVDLLASSGSFSTGSLAFTPQTTGAPLFAFSGTAGPTTTPSLWMDSLAITQGAATLVDRRSFRKTYVLDTNMSLTGASAAAIGDVFLAGHRNTPFKGTLNLVGPGSIRRIRGGQVVTMGELLRNTGELIQFSHLTDPDTGGLGRYGRIASVSLSGPWSASVQIDSTIDSLQALLNRIQVNTAQVR